MRPTLSSLIRSVLLRESPSADEAVRVYPSSLRMKDAKIEDTPGDDYVPGRKYSESERAAIRHAVKLDAVKTHAFVNREKWRGSVERHFAFLDAHSRVGDVIVIPIAGTQEGVSAIAGLIRPSGAEQGRVSVVGVEEARGLLAQMDIDMAGAGPRDVVVVPVVGAGFGVPANERMLSTAWMTVHAMFEPRGTRLRPHLPKCYEALADVEALIEDVQMGADPLLLNCGWSENAFHMVVAAHRRSQSTSTGSVYDTLVNDFKMPPVGTRFRSHDDVPVHPGKGFEGGTFYVFRGKEDVAPEIMTIAAVKPNGLMPVMERFDQIPDEILREDAEFHNIGSPGQTSFTPEERLEIRAAVEKMLNEIKQITSDVRDRLAEDLLGKAIIFSVH